jgi:hypothetical protein
MIMPKTLNDITKEEWDKICMQHRLSSKTRTGVINSAFHMFAEALTDMQDVIDLGGVKYGYGSYLDIDNNSMQHSNNCSSMFRHLSAHLIANDNDTESGKDHLLHLAFRALAAYQRKLKFNKGE